MESSIPQAFSHEPLNATTTQRAIELLRHWFPRFSAVYYGCFLYLLPLDGGFDLTSEAGKGGE